jgi:hypothetical protein
LGRNTQLIGLIEEVRGILPEEMKKIHLQDNKGRTLELTLERKSLTEEKIRQAIGGEPLAKLQHAQIETEIRDKLDQMKDRTVRRWIALGTLFLGFLTFAQTTKSPSPSEDTMPSYVYSVHETLFRFLRPLLIKIDAVLLECLKSLQSGVNPRYVKQSLIDFLRELREKEIAARSTGSFIVSKQMTLRIDELISTLRKLNPPSDFDYGFMWRNRARQP